MTEKIVYEFQHFGGKAPKFGGITTIVEQIDHGVFSYRYSICSPRDIFCKKIGVAFAQADQAKIVEADYTIRSFDAIMCDIYADMLRVEKVRLEQFQIKNSFSLELIEAAFYKHRNRLLDYLCDRLTNKLPKTSFV